MAITVGEVISRVREIKDGNGYRDDIMARWIAKIENMVLKEVLKRNDSVRYTEEDMNVELSAPTEHEDIYEKYVISMIDMSNQEYGRYNNSAMAFEAAYDDYRKWYRRNNIPDEPPSIKVVI